MKFKNLILICKILFLLFPVSFTYAATVNLIKKESFTANLGLSNEIYFDDHNQLKLISIEPYEMHALKLPSICETKDLLFHSPTHQVYLQNPRIDVQKCSPNATYPLGYDLVIGLSSNNKEVIWHHPLTIKNENIIDYRNIIGASDEGVVLYSYNTNKIEILNPHTGLPIYPLSTDVPISFAKASHALFDSQRKILYIAHNEGTLHKLNLNNQKIDQIAILPSQWITKIPLRVYKMVFTHDKRFLALIGHIGSRLYGHDTFLIFDLNTNELIYKKNLDSPYPHGSQLVSDKNDQLAVSFTDGKGKRYLYLYQIRK